MSKGDIAKRRTVKKLKGIIEILILYPRYNPDYVVCKFQELCGFCQIYKLCDSCDLCPIFKAEKKKCYKTDWYKKIEKAIKNYSEDAIPLLLALKMWIETLEIEEEENE